MGLLHEQLYKLMYITHNILVESNIWYIADDVDISVLATDVSAIKKMRQEFTKKGCSLKWHREGWLKVKIKGTNASLDMLPIYLENDRTYYDIDIDSWNKCHHLKSDIFPIEKCKFGSGYVFVPKNSKPYLDKCYGKTWKTKGFLTQDSVTHYDLDKPVKLRVNKFDPAKPYSDSSKQIKVRKGAPYTKGESEGWCKEFRNVVFQK
jgi:hypothetical protein